MELDPLIKRWGLVAVSSLGLGLVLLAIAWIVRRDGRAALPAHGGQLRPNLRQVGVLLAGFVGLTALIQLPGVDAAETTIIEQVFRKGGLELQRAIKTLSDAGGFRAMCLVVTLLVILLLYLGRGRSVRFFLAVMAGELALEGIFKPLLYRARPPLKARVFFDSYPSGHAMAATILVGVLLCIWLPVCRRRWQRSMLWSAALAWPLLIGASRVYLGRHYVSDILAGFLLGAAWVLLCRRLLIMLSKPDSASVAIPDVDRKLAA